jgi:hypothetical protein
VQNPVGAGGFGLLPFLTERINVLNAAKKKINKKIMMSV